MKLEGWIAIINNWPETDRTWWIAQKRIGNLVETIEHLIGVSQDSEMYRKRLVSIKPCTITIPDSKEAQGG